MPIITSAVAPSADVGYWLIVAGGCWREGLNVEIWYVRQTDPGEVYHLARLGEWSGPVMCGQPSPSPFGWTLAVRSLLNKPWSKVCEDCRAEVYRVVSHGITTIINIGQGYVPTDSNSELDPRLDPSG